MDDPVDITSKMPEKFAEEIASKKWQERKEAMEKLQSLLNLNPRLDPKGRYDDLIQILITAISKDSNINVASLAAKCLTAVARGLRKDFRPHVRASVSAIFAKFKEKKPVLRDALVECIDAAAATAPLEMIVEDIVEASTKPNPDIKIQLDLFLYRTIKSLKPAEVPKKFLKEFTPVLVKHTGESDPEVRNAACSALGAIMMVVGQKAANVLFGELTADKMKMSKIEEACAKATQEVAEEETARRAEAEFDAPAFAQSSTTSVVAPAAVALPVQQAEPAEMDPWDLADPVDITSKMPEKFAEEIASKKWQERKEAMEKLQSLLNLNPRLDPKGRYDDLIQILITAISKDSNINVASLAAKCLTAVARGLRKDFRPHVRASVSAIFAKFKEKKPVLRDALVECIDAAAAAAPLEMIVEDIVEASTKPNPDIKIQLDLFLYRTIKSLKPAEVPKKFLKDFTPVLVKHTGDSDPEVRNAACSALGAIMKVVGQKAANVLFGELTADKMKMAKVEEFYNQAVTDSGVEIESMVQSVYKPDPPKPTAAVEQPPPPAAVPVVSVDEAVEEVGDFTPLKTKKRDPAEEAEPKAKVQSPPKPVEEKAPEEPAALLKAQSDRAGRAKEEKAHKLLKWNFDMPTPEHTQQLYTQIGEVAKPALSAQLLNKDFKQHIKAIDYLQQLLVTEPAAIVNNVDILLRWATLRFFDTNPSVLMRLMEFICASFSYMDEQEERLTELEMTSFLPYLLLKCGDQKEVIRNNVRKIVKLMGGISIPGKIFPLLLDGLKTKNSRQKSDCLIIIESFLECMGVNITPTPQQTMKVLASCISDRDSSVRNAALNAIVTVYKKIGDRVFPLIGQLNEKERAMLDERIKRSGKMVAPDSENHNMTLNATSTPRARSSSAVRRPLNVSNVSAIHPDDETTVLGDQSMTTALNSTITKRPQPRGGSRPRQSMGATSRFQLDPKFFNNDIDLGDNIGVSAADTSRVAAAGGAGLNIDGDVSDFKGVPPAIRPPARGTHFSKRSESVSSISSLESAEQIDRTVHNLSCLQLRVATEATAQLRHLLQDLPNKSYVEERCELILKTLITQFFQLRSQHFETLEPGADSYEVSEVLRCICNFLLAMIDSPALRQVSAETTRGFIDALICLMADKRIELLSGCKQIIRSLNMLALRVCASSSPTNVTIALLKLLTKYQSSDPQGAVIDVVRKCIYKNSDCFLDVKRTRDVDVPAIIEPLYAYYHKFHADQPSCTTEALKGNHRVLTILIQRLVLLERYKILNYLYPYPENSVLVHYIRRCARALSKTPQGAAGLADTTGALDTTTTGGNTTAMMSGSTVGTMVAKSMPEEMVQLFQRINNAEIFDGCVEELYNFLDVNNEQNGNFEELLSTCPFGCLIQRAFVEIRQSRLRKEPLAAGECVLRVLPPEDREFVEEQQTLQAKLDGVMQNYEGSTPTLTTTGASQQQSLSSEA